MYRAIPSAHVVAAPQEESQEALGEVGYGHGRAYAVLVEQQGVVEGTLGLGGAQESIDDAVQEVGFLERLGHELVLPKLQAAQLIAPAVYDFPPLAGEDGGQGSEEVGAFGIFGSQGEMSGTGG